MMEKKAGTMKKKSLADKISSLITTTPANFGSDEEAEDTKAKVIERYDESDDADDNLRYSKIRTQNVNLLDQVDKRYAGKKVSRKDVYDDNDTNSSVDSENENSAEDVKDEELCTDDDNDDCDDDDDNLYKEEASTDVETNTEQTSEESEDQSDIDDKDYDVDTGNPLYRDRGAKFETMTNTNIRSEINKGNCVRNQLKVWESLLEMRIKFHKCLVSSNQIPQYNVYKDFRTEAEFVKKTNETKSKLTLLLNNMLQLQSSLLKQNPETKDLMTRKRKMDENKNNETNVNDSMDEEIPSDTEDEKENEELSASEKEVTEEPKESIPQKRLKLGDYEKLLDENHKCFVEYRNSVIQKWNEKTRIATGNLKGMSQTTLKQIEFALSDKEKLRKRTQLKRSEYNIVGKVEATEGDTDGRRVQEYDSEIYDDDDFYHQLLRDLIEYKSSDVTDPIQLSKQWIQLQNMRSKMKRKIDTRATKGRKIRYNVHNKLVNFMAPITIYDTWTDHAKNELYNSLFGKIKSTDGAISN